MTENKTISPIEAFGDDGFYRGGNRGYVYDGVAEAVLCALCG
jgi:hypothetical protein